MVPSANMGGCLVIGHFDGLHRGHAVLISRARQLVGENGTVVVMGFSPHARQFFAQNQAPFLLQTTFEKARHLERMGVDVYYELCFDKDFADLSPSDFISKHIVEACNPRYVVVGDDFRFGKNRQGGVKDLIHDERIQTLPMGLLKDREFGTVSSSKVRNGLIEGDVAGVTLLLGRYYSVCGEVQKGDGVAGKEGVATANIGWHKDRLKIRFGVYVVRVSLEGNQDYFGVANFGLRPTFGDHLEPRLEVHLFDFKGALYGQVIEVSFLHYVRDEQKFSSKDVLFQQIARDIEISKEFIAVRFSSHL